MTAESELPPPVAVNSMSVEFPKTGISTSTVMVTTSPGLRLIRGGGAVVIVKRGLVDVSVKT